ncbi:MAG: signal peptide peptidase SppA [Planctomycetaceae bacterium]|nr:signal peptide peptidase SppA [Planctomycetaceae bacterium]
MSAENEPISIRPGESRTVSGGTVVVRVEAAAAGAGFFRRFLLPALLMSLFLNFVLLLATASTTATSSDGVLEKFRSGEQFAGDKLAVVQFSGTIMPPYTERWLDQLKHAADDSDVKAVLLEVDSPGGLVADSHQLLHEIQKLAKNKPVFVAMKRLAASGGYYLSMGIGPKGLIFAEPTTWTGSIGVIIPRYNASELASKIGVQVESLTTGSLKDTLNPFRDLTDEERTVWDAILTESFDRFVGVITDNRPSLSEEQVRKLATGQIYTADQALQNGLVDEIGFSEEAVAALASRAGVSSYQVVEYQSAPTLMDLLLGRAPDVTQSGLAKQFLDAAVPKAMYYCSWNPWVPSSGH